MHKPKEKAMQLTKCDRLRRFMKKHPEVTKMSYAEYEQYPRAPEIIDRDFYRIRKEFEEAAQEVVQTSGRKLDQIVARFKDKMKSGGREAVKSYDYETFVAESKIEVTREWFQRLRRRFLAERHGSRADVAEVPRDPSNIISPQALIEQKVRELKELLERFKGCRNLKLSYDVTEHVEVEV